MKIHNFSMEIHSFFDPKPARRVRALQSAATVHQGTPVIALPEDVPLLLELQAEHLALHGQTPRATRARHQRLGLATECDIGGRLIYR